MIIGAHSIIYSKKPEADRAFLRDVLGLPNVDVGEGWLIVGLQPAEARARRATKRTTKKSRAEVERQGAQEVVERS